MQSYDDDHRKADNARLRLRSDVWYTDHLNPADAGAALAVFLLDPQLRPVLEALDPKAVEQARKAMKLT